MPRKPAKPNKDYKGKKAKFCSTITLKTGKTIAVCNNSKNASKPIVKDPKKPAKFTRKKITKGYSSYKGRFKTGGRIKKPGAGPRKGVKTKADKVKMLLKAGLKKEFLEKRTLPEINELIRRRKKRDDRRKAR